MEAWKEWKVSIPPVSIAVVKVVIGVIKDEMRGRDMNELVSLAAEINREHNLAEQMAKTAIEHALKAGELLLQAKDQCGHGEWLLWLDDNLAIGARQAQKYMRLVTHREMLANTSDNSHLTIDAALAAIAAPREAERSDIQPHEMLDHALAVIDQLRPP